MIDPLAGSPDRSRPAVHQGMAKLLAEHTIRSLHNGQQRTIFNVDALIWLRSQPSLPSNASIITSLPDVCELEGLYQGQPPMSSSAYTTWFSNVVSLTLSKLHPSQVAIFYQTDGRHSCDGGWLDKSFLAHLGAREANAACVWHRIVCTSPIGQARTSRPGFAHLLCFSTGHQDAAGSPAVDVLPE